MKFRLVFPEKRVVDSDVIAGWYSDAVANNEVDAVAGFVSVREKAAALDDAGLITVAEYDYGYDRNDGGDFDVPARSDETELEAAIDDALAAQYDDDPSPYLGNYSED